MDVCQIKFCMKKISDMLRPVWAKNYLVFFHTEMNEVYIVLKVLLSKYPRQSDIITKEGNLE
jgi:hypothetical protein